MNKQEKGLLAALNAALGQAGLNGKFEPHKFWPISKTFVVLVGSTRLIRVWPERRHVDVFVWTDMACGSGYSFGGLDFSGQRWMENLVDYAVGLVRSERSQTCTIA